MSGNLSKYFYISSIVLQFIQISSSASGDCILVNWASNCGICLFVYYAWNHKGNCLQRSLSVRYFVIHALAATDWFEYGECKTYLRALISSFC